MKNFRKYWTYGIIIPLLIIISLAGCKNDSSENDDSTQAQETNAVLFTSELNSHLQAAGLTPEQAKIISDGALLETTQVISQRLTRSSSNDDITNIAPAIVRGAMKKIPDAGLDHDFLLIAIKTISGSPIQSLKDRVTNLSKEQQGALINSITKEATGNLSQTGISSLEDIIIAVKEVTVGATQALGNSGLTKSTLALAIKEVNSGSVSGLGIIKNAISGLNDNLAKVVANIAVGSISALDSIGLSQEEITFSVTMVTAGTTAALDDAGVTDLAQISTIISVTTTTTAAAVVGALDTAGLSADYIASAAIGIADATYTSLNEAGVSDANATSMLTEIKDAAINGLSDIDDNLIEGTFDSNTATNTLATYDGTYVNPYATAMDDDTGDTDTISPIVISVSPFDQTDKQSIAATITIAFSEAMDQASAEGAGWSNTDTINILAFNPDPSGANGSSQSVLIDLGFFSTIASNPSITRTLTNLSPNYVVFYVKVLSGIVAQFTLSKGVNPIIDIGCNGPNGDVTVNTLTPYPGECTTGSFMKVELKNINWSGSGSFDVYLNDILLDSGLNFAIPTTDVDKIDLAVSGPAGSDGTDVVYDEIIMY